MLGFYMEKIESIQSNTSVSIHSCCILLEYIDPIPLSTFIVVAFFWGKLILIPLSAFIVVAFFWNILILIPMSASNLI